MTGPSLTRDDLHVRAEAAGLDLRSALAQRRDEVCRRAARRRAGGRGVPGRSPALAGVAVQRELTDHQQRGAHVGRGPLVVAGCAARAPSRRAVGHLFGVVVGDADEDAEPLPGAVPMRPTTSPSTVTPASRTRCTTARMQAMVADPRQGARQPRPNRPLRFFLSAPGPAALTSERRVPEDCLRTRRPGRSRGWRARAAASPCLPGRGQPSARGGRRPPRAPASPSRRASPAPRRASAPPVRCG